MINKERIINEFCELAAIDSPSYHPESRLIHTKKLSFIVVLPRVFQGKAYPLL